MLSDTYLNKETQISPWKPSPYKIAKFHHQWMSLGYENVKWEGLIGGGCRNQILGFWNTWKCLPVENVECSLQRHVRYQSVCGRFTAVEDKVTQGSRSMGQVPIEEAKCDLKGGSHLQSLRPRPIWGLVCHLDETLEDGWLFLHSLQQYVQDSHFRDTVTLVWSLSLPCGLHKRDLKKVLSRLRSPAMPSLPLPEPWHQGTSDP